MKGAIALLDIESVMIEQSQDRQQVDGCLQKMHYRGIKKYYITKRITPAIDQWLKDNKISPYQSDIQENHIGLLNYLLRRFPPNWEIGLITRQIRLIEHKADMGTVERREHGLEQIGEIGQIEMAKMIFFTHDEAKRQSVTNHFLYNPRVQICASLKEVADSMDIPDEAFTKNDQTRE